MIRFEILALAVTVIWLSAGLKLAYDQMALFKAYRSKVDSKFSISPAEIMSSSQSIFAVFGKRLRLIFGKHPGHPEIDALAKRVRYDLIAVPVLTGLIAVSLFFWV